MPQNGSFSTEEQHGWDQPALECKKDVTVQPNTPNVTWGINLVDMDKGTNQRVNTFVDNLKPAGFQAHINTWGDTKFYRGGIDWFVPDDCDFQTGSFDTQEDHPYQDNKPKTTKKVVFRRPFAAPPKVVVWLRAWDIEKTANFRVTTYVDSITATDFALHIDTWGDSRLFSAAANWIAYPADKIGVSSGAYSTSDVRSPNDKTLTNSKAITFDASAKFEAPPVVMTGITAIDFDRTMNVRIKLTEDGISKTGFTWHIDSWGNSIFYAGNAMYLAYAAPKAGA